MPSKQFFQTLDSNVKLWNNSKFYRFYFLYHRFDIYQLIISQCKPTEINNGLTTRQTVGTVCYSGVLGRIDETYNQFILDRFYNRYIGQLYEEITDEPTTPKSYVKYLLVPKKQYTTVIGTVKTYQPPTPKRRDDRKTLDGYLESVNFWGLISQNCKLLSGETYLLQRDKAYWYRALLNNEPVALEALLSEIADCQDALSGLQKASQSLGTDEFYVICPK